MAAAVIGSGVVKSGSPIVRLMTSFISSSMSKKRRMPDGGIVAHAVVQEVGGRSARWRAGWSSAPSLAAGTRTSPGRLRLRPMEGLDLVLLLLAVVAAVTADRRRRSGSPTRS